MLKRILLALAMMAALAACNTPAATTSPTLESPSAPSLESPSGAEPSASPSAS